MSQADDETTGAPEALVLARFHEAHPGGSETDFEAWADGQPELASDGQLRASVSKLVQDWLRAEKLLALGMDIDDGGSVFRRRGGGPRESAGPAPGGEALHVGKRIGSFILKRFIAKGGMGQVWEAEDTELRRKVALKLVLPDRIDERSLELFAREARAGGRLNHPNLVTTLAYGTDDGLSWIAQEPPASTPGPTMVRWRPPPSRTASPSAPKPAAPSPASAIPPPTSAPPAKASRIHPPSSPTPTASLSTPPPA